MRVQHVIRSDGFAGVERHVATLAAAQARAGHEVSVVGGDPRQMRGVLETAGVETIPGNSVSEVIRQLLRRRFVDIRHAHMTAGELAAVLTTPRTPIVATRHFARQRGDTPVGRAAASVIRRRISTQIAISEYVAASVEGTAAVVYPGVDVDVRPPTPRAPVALVVQRLQPEKDTTVALQTFAVGAPSDWRLKVVGRGVELPTLKGLAEELGIADRVDFLGFRSDVPDLMRASSVLIAPCPVEGLGLSVLEAMSHGLPVIAAASGAHPETVGRSARARLFTPGDWRQAGDQLAGLCGDPLESAAYGADLQLVQQAQFTPEAQVRATDAVYESVLR